MPDGAASPEAADGYGLIVSLDGYEGPLHLLLDLARRSRVDLTRLSILALADQFIAFVEEARHGRIEIAADHLVMAAWLAYLKSRLLLPKPPPGAEPQDGDPVERLAFRLRRLEAMRGAAAALMERPRLGQDVFARGAPESLAANDAHGPWTATLFDLLSAYARQRRSADARVTVRPRPVVALAEARALIERVTGEGPGDWLDLDAILAAVAPAALRSARASGFAAGLELVREGRLAMRQDRPFAPLFVRRTPET